MTTLTLGEVVKIEKAETKIVGVNYMKAENENSTLIEVFEYPEAYAKPKEKFDSYKIPSC